MLVNRYLYPFYIGICTHDSIGINTHDKMTVDDFQNVTQATFDIHHFSEKNHTEKSYLCPKICKDA